MANLAGGKVGSHPTSTSEPTDAPAVPAALPFPDFSAIGDAFAQVISYINSQKHISLDAAARDWLILAGRRVMERLKEEFEKLYKNKDNPMLLPAYALGPEGLSLTERIPPALLPYKDQFRDYFRQLLKACNLNAEVTCLTFFAGCINIKIMFFELLKDIKSEAIGNLNLDVDFQKEMFKGLENLKL